MARGGFDMKRSLSRIAALLFVVAGAVRVWSQAPAQPGAQTPGGKGGTPRPASVATLEDIAEMARLAALPAWTAGSGDEDYSVGPEYAPAPEQKQRVGIPHGKLVEFFMNSAESKIYPGRLSVSSRSTSHASMFRVRRPHSFFSRTPMVCATANSQIFSTT